MSKLAIKNFNEMKNYTNQIMDSEIFQAATRTDHHFGYNIACHEIHVCIVAMFMAYMLSRIGIHFQMHSMIRGILCHDLGLVGRYEKKFYSGLDCALRHPVESVKIARNLLPDLDAIEEDIIVKHMFPMNVTGIPRYKETWIVTIADKWCAITEGLHLNRIDWIARAHQSYI